MKGQVKIEFILGVVVFAIIIFYIGSQIGTAFLTVNTDSRLDMLKSKSITILDIITKNSTIGLALTPNVLDESKIQDWNNNKVNNMCPDLNIFNLDGYRLIINKGDTEVLFCGYVGVSRIRTNVVRYVKIGDEYGDVTLEMW
ncbi:MAG: hypothetical protein PHU12_01920 [Candidatus Aenigmarchaeota archaeon]|nr:hypothetical protein [Candidatus Aenigmarchaeota archaeon]